MKRVYSLIASLFVLTVLVVGCSEPTKTAKGPDKKKDEKKDDHSGWWCEEHGVPEHMCSLCSAEVAAKCKKEGDWCDKHDRAKSQCFICDPTKYDKFEDMYVKKFNEKPKRPNEDQFKE